MTGPLHMLRVSPSTSRPGMHFWHCEAATCRDSGGFTTSIDAANTAARRHAVHDCPTVAAATDKLLAAVLALPDFRPVWLIRAYPMYGCQRPRPGSTHPRTLGKQQRMSIWGTHRIDEPSIWGLDGDDLDGQGEPCIYVALATTYLDQARLTLTGENGSRAADLDAEVLLGPEEMRRLASQLLEVADICEKKRGQLNPDWEAQAKRIEDRHRKEIEDNKRYMERLMRELPSCLRDQDRGQA